MPPPLPAAPTHLPVLAEIHAAAFPSSEAWGADAIGLQLALPGVAGWVDPRGGMILVRRAIDEMEVLTLAVVPGARRRGVGTALLRAAFAWAEGERVSAVYLEVARDNAAALSLYQRMGFSLVGQRRRYYRSGTDALVLRCQLDPAGNGSAAV
jgi:[ribosomal protein S18]-alanine N-acetyltransferase